MVSLGANHLTEKMNETAEEGAAAVQELCRAQEEIKRLNRRRYEDKQNYDRQLAALTSEIEQLRQRRESPNSQMSGSVMTGSDATTQALNSINQAYERYLRSSINGGGCVKTCNCQCVKLETPLQGLCGRKVTVIF